jgi:iron(III) transport system permease protein
MSLAAALALGASLPAPLLGVWVIAALNRPTESPLALLGMLYDQSLVAPIFVQSVRALPLVSLWLWSQLASVPVELLDAARAEGAGRWTQLRRIALPMRRPGLAAAAVAALAIAMGELSATLLVLPPGVTTISVRVFQLLHYPMDDRAAALCLSIFAIIALGVLAASVAGGIRTRRHRVTLPAPR